MTQDAVETESERPQVFVVDDELASREVLARAAERGGYRASVFETGSGALAALEQRGEQVDLLLTDLDMPAISGHQLMSTVQAKWPQIVNIVITGASDIALAVRAMREGAYDYLVKPVDPTSTLLPTMARALEKKRLLDQNLSLKRQLGDLHRSSAIIGESQALAEVLHCIRGVAPTDATVLVLGETGTGKELVARAIHDSSRRNSRPFIPLNCGALAPSILESELFGHARGAFTGADSARRGLFEEASGGTLFLDEVGELEPSTQVKLLRVLQENQVRPLGSNRPIDIDVRVVAATNRDLEQEVHDGNFREDLFYRLDVMRLELPPLRDRSEDIPALAHHFLRKRAEQLGKQVSYIDDDVLSRFVAHPWPGNIRELENAIDRAIVLAKGDTIGVDLLHGVLRTPRIGNKSLTDPRLFQPLADAKNAFEEEYVRSVMQRASGKLADAAKLAGMDRSNFRRLLKRLNIEGSD